MYQGCGKTTGSVLYTNAKGKFLYKIRNPAFAELMLPKDMKLTAHKKSKRNTTFSKNQSTL